MDIVLITDFSRIALFQQTVETLRDNASYDHHRLFLVVTGRHTVHVSYPTERLTVVSPFVGGVGLSKNHGATIGTDDIILFSDDDIYYMRGWDEQLQAALDEVTLIGACAHPFNFAVGGRCHSMDVAKVDAVSGNCCAIRRKDWNKYGPFDPTTEPAMSEDVKLSGEIVRNGGKLGVTLPFCAVHCGLTNCRGKDIVGRDALERFNNEFIAATGLREVLMI